MKFFTLVLAASVAVVAWLQWWVALNKLRLDLFDRRYKVYQATRKFLAVMFSNAKFTSAELFEFDAGTSDAEFLFRTDVVEYLAQIRRQALDLHTTEQLLEKPRLSDDELSRYAQARKNDLSRLGDQITAISKTFTPYLGFANIQLRFWPSLKLNRKQRILTIIALIAFVVIGACHYLAWPPIVLYDRVPLYVWKQLTSKEAEKRGGWQVFVAELQQQGGYTDSQGEWSAFGKDSDGFIPDDAKVWFPVATGTSKQIWKPYFNGANRYNAMVPDVRIPWFMLGVIYAGMFFLLADRKEKR